MNKVFDIEIEKYFKDKQEGLEKQSADQPTMPKPTQMLPDNMQWAWDPKANQWVAVMKDNPTVTPPTYNPTNQQNYNQTTNYMSTVKSSIIDSLNQFLDGPKYKSEVKNCKNLIKEELIKYAGFNPVYGTKYSISQKGLQFLKSAADEEFNKELENNVKDHIKNFVKDSYLLDGISDSKIQTGSSTDAGNMQKLFDIFEQDGEKLASRIEADNETDAKLKFIMKNPQYEDSLTIKAKCVFASYFETTQKGLDYPSNSVSPSDDIILENHDGWVNTAKQSNENFAKLHDLIGQYKKNDLIDGVYELDDNLVLTGSPETINELEHKVKDVGYHCEAVDETLGDDIETKWSLKIFMK